MGAWTDEWKKNRSSASKQKRAAGTRIPAARGIRPALRQVRSRPRRGGLLSEALDRCGFVVVGVEDGHQLRHLQHFLELRSEVRELQRCALRTRAVERRDERAKARAVDISDVGKVENDLLLTRR